MAKFPNPPPPARLVLRPPQIHKLPAGTSLWRIYFRGGTHPAVWNEWRAYGPLATGRFDHHLAPPRVQARQILYAAVEIVTCLAEVFQSTRVIDTARRQPWLVGFTTARPLLLLDLTGTWPTAVGAPMAIASGPRPRAQRWARAAYEAYPDIHGLWYGSSMHANHPALALFERAVDVASGLPFYHRALADPILLGPLRNAAHDLGYGLV